jgi:hypothetical protein
MQFVAGWLAGWLSQINAALVEVALPQLHGDNKCFDLEVTLEDGCWLLCAAALLSLGGGWMVLIQCHNGESERDTMALCVRPAWESCESLTACAIRLVGTTGAGGDNGIDHNKN